MSEFVSAARFHSVFNPESVAVIGASAGFGKWGQLITSNIVAGGYRGHVYPVNPRETNICGLSVYRDIRGVPGPVDLAFITTPAPTVPAILNACGDKGVSGIVLITSGFSETDDAGKPLEFVLFTLPAACSAGNRSPAGR